MKGIRGLGTAALISILGLGVAGFRADHEPNAGEGPAAAPLPLAEGGDEAPPCVSPTPKRRAAGDAAPATPIEVAAAPRGHEARRGHGEPPAREDYLLWHDGETSWIKVEGGHSATIARRPGIVISDGARMWVAETTTRTQKTEGCCASGDCGAGDEVVSGLKIDRLTLRGLAGAPTRSVPTRPFFELWGDAQWGSFDGTLTLQGGFGALLFLSLNATSNQCGAHEEWEARFMTHDAATDSALVYKPNASAAARLAGLQRRAFIAGPDDALPPECDDDGPPVGGAPGCCRLALPDRDYRACTERWRSSGRAQRRARVRASGGAIPPDEVLLPRLTGYSLVAGGGKPHGDYEFEISARRDDASAPVDLGWIDLRRARAVVISGGTIEALGMPRAFPEAVRDALVNLEGPFGYARVTATGAARDALLATFKDKPPSAARALIKRGRELTRAKRYPEAIAAFDAAIAAEPRAATAWSGRGYARLSAGDVAGAEADLTHALGLDGTPAFQARVWYNLGLVAVKVGDKAAEEEAWSKSHALRPTPATAKRLRALRHEPTP